MTLREKQLAFQILTPCTLNCRLCADYAPLYRQKGISYFVTLENFCKEIEGVFRIYDFIEDLTITGGEPLLHKQLPEILAYTLQNFAQQFDQCRIFTNGTLPLEQRLVDVVHENATDNFQFVIDDYGIAPKEVSKFKTAIEAEKIAYRVNEYYGKEQYCGGWVDYGPLDRYRSYSEETVENLIRRCHNANWKNLLVFRGKLYLCTQGAFGHDLGYFELDPEDYVDLFDETIALERKKAIAARFGTHATNACQYCNGFDVEHSKRFPAGEQL